MDPVASPNIAIPTYELCSSAHSNPYLMLDINSSYLSLCMWGENFLLSLLMCNG